MSKIYEIKYETEMMRNSVPASDIVGKKVIAKNGKKIGEIKAVHIHPRRMTVEGITVKKGIMEMKDFIGKNYIKSLNNQGAMLSIIPVHELIGMDVYDRNERKVGKVKSVNRARKTNTLTTILVHKGVLKKDLVVSGRDIREIDKNVTLKIGIRE